MSIEKYCTTNKDKIMDMIKESVSFIEKKFTSKPELAIVLGSGLGDFVDRLDNPIIINFEDIPHFPKPTVEGHSGKLYIGNLHGKDVIIMKGRYHYYEGYETQTITYPIRVFAQLGITKLILTNACGGINKQFKPGDLMIIEDQIAFLCPSPLRGPHLDEFGPRFTDMSCIYTPEYIELAEKCAEELQMSVQKGVYAYWPGPCYESPAEIRAFMALGADAVGMSTVSESAVAVNCGMKILGISCITNMTSEISKRKTTHEEVIEMGKKVASKFVLLLDNIIRQI